MCTDMWYINLRNVKYFHYRKFSLSVASSATDLIFVILILLLGFRIIDSYHIYLFIDRIVLL